MFSPTCSSTSMLLSTKKPTSPNLRIPQISMRPTRGAHGFPAIVKATAAAFPKIEKLGEDVSTLSLEEARGLVDWLQDTLSVSIASFAPAIAVPVIEEVHSNARIATIKVVRALTNLALKEGKDIIEGLPKNFREWIWKEDVKKQIEAVGVIFTAYLRGEKSTHFIEKK
ncbi:hypothetical protein AMTRI_Chr05g71280 [Amborella trichopoda]